MCVHARLFPPLLLILFCLQDIDESSRKRLNPGFQIPMASYEVQSGRPSTNVSNFQDCVFSKEAVDWWMSAWRKKGMLDRGRQANHNGR